MAAREYDFEFHGYDLSEVMIKKARSLYSEKGKGRFDQSDVLEEADYTIASGLFNVKMDVDPKDWEGYILGVLDKINQASRKGFSFNALTRYSDKEYMKDNLYYSDPCFYFDHCKRNYSSYVALLHDYPLYEFSILVRKGV